MNILDLGHFLKHILSENEHNLASMEFQIRFDYYEFQMNFVSLRNSCQNVANFLNKLSNVSAKLFHAEYDMRIDVVIVE